MQSIWNEVVSLEADRYEGTISEILFNSRAINDRYAPIRTVGTLEIFVAVFPFDENDNQSKIIHRKVTAEGAYVFGRFTRDFLVGHTLKRVDIYPDIIRLCRRSKPSTAHSHPSCHLLSAARVEPAPMNANYKASHKESPDAK